MNYQRSKIDQKYKNFVLIKILWRNGVVYMREKIVIKLPILIFFVLICKIRTKWTIFYAKARLRIRYFLYWREKCIIEESEEPYNITIAIFLWNIFCGGVWVLSRLTFSWDTSRTPFCTYEQNQYFQQT